MLKQKPTHLLIAVLSCVLFIIIGYGIDRHETISLLSCYLLLFLLYCAIVGSDAAQLNIKFWLGASIAFRLALLFSMPELSDDFYRFLWDGRVIAAGYNPFNEVPSYYMNLSAPVPGLDEELFEKLNSKVRYSSYPPLCQLIFWISAELSPSSIFGSAVAMRAILFVFELVTLWILNKLIREFHLPAHSILLYALNPLVILEITGNLHFEGVMIFFLMLAIFLLIRKWFWFSCAAFALSVCTKLIPLLFLPQLLPYLGLKKAFMYWLTTGIITLILFMSLLSAGLLHGFSTSLGYYFQYFEFNASIYYVIRGIGQLIFGFNIIQYAGPLLALAGAIAILTISFRGVHQGENYTPAHLFKVMLWCLFIYFALTTILHPWYIVTLLSISLFTRYRFPILWTGLIFLTYAGYTEYSFRENLVVVAMEYLLLLAYILYETLWKREPVSS